MDAVNTPGKQRGRPFAKGKSGNPAGKPKGRRNSTTMAAQSLLDGEAKKLTRKAVDLALAGDTLALRLCLDRIIPPRKDRPVILESIPQVKSGSDTVEVMGRVVESVADGTLTPAEGEMVGQVLGLFCKALETKDFEERLQRLEGMVKDDSGTPATEG